MKQQSPGGRQGSRGRMRAGRGRRLIGGILLGWLVLLGVAGCGTTNESAPLGDVARGQRLFVGEEKLRNDNLQSCASCHSNTVEGESAIGQNLSNIGNRADKTVQGQSAIQYLRTSLIDPDAFLSGGFQEGIMPRNYAQTLTEQDINDLIAYMLTLKSGKD